MYKVACNKKELSCIISTIFEELLPVCEECSSDDENMELIIKGRLIGSEEIAILKIKDYGCDFTGDIRIINTVIRGICLYDATSNITEES